MERLNSLTKINLLAILFVIIMNTLIVVSDKMDYINIIIYILPFIIVGLVLLLFREYQSKISKYLMLILGLIITLFGNPGNFSGAIFIIYSIHLDPGRNKTIIKLGLLIVAITCKTLIIDISTVQTVSLLFINGLCYAYYYILFTEKKVITINEIEDQTEQIIDYLIDGFEIKEIAVKTCLSPAAVSKRINRLRDKEGCRTTIQLIAKLSIDRHLSKKIDRFKVS